MKSAKHCDKPLSAQIDVVAEYHVHRIAAERIAYRTGIPLSLVTALIDGSSEHQRLFKRRIEWHRRQRREQRLRASLRLKGTARTQLQQQIEQDFRQQQLSQQ